MAELSVPGNLLLGGEYAVLEDGGLGVALAVEPRARATVRPARRFTVTGRTGPVTETVFERFDSSEELVPLVVSRALDFAAVVMDLPAERLRRRPPACAIEVDSSAFYGPDGRKLGFGSSAAVAVCLTAAVLETAGLHRSEAARHTPALALQAHRQFQNGRGSGYDVLASFHGGAGLFTGGGSPGWAAIEPGWIGGLAVYNNPSPVTTPGSIGRYEEWKRRRPPEARAFLENSNRAVRRFAEAVDWDEGSDAFRRLRAIGLSIGKAVGVPADTDAVEAPPARLGECEIKAAGAGDELVVCVSRKAAAPDAKARTDSGGWRPARISFGGLRWE